MHYVEAFTVVRVVPGLGDDGVAGKEGAGAS